VDDQVGDAMVFPEPAPAMMQRTAEFPVLKPDAVFDVRALSVFSDALRSSSADLIRVGVPVTFYTGCGPPSIVC
jgi:hypothetical protein